jgi:hypothetical protein
MTDYIQPPIPGVRSYLRGLVIKSETVPSNDTSDGQKVCTACISLDLI